ncbi:MAG TPA: hypothetical protein VEU47_00855 [Candidatus Cybelea sp.]|nr:hypothetical protein [Candidatus Cybelea sp.]
MGGIRASIVGSLPKPAAMAEPERLFAPWRESGAALAAAQDAAVVHWLDAQAAAGLHIVTDGEQRRRHYIWGWLEGLTGIDTETLGSKASRGGRYQKETAVARIVGEVAWRSPVLGDAVRFARGHTKQILKVTLPGPMTTADSVLDVAGRRSDADLAMMFAELLNREAIALVDAGADVVQFDEPCFNIYVDQVKDWGIATLERAMRDVKATRAVHICYGYGVPRVLDWKTQNRDWGHYGRTLPLLAKSSVDQISIETAASGVDVSVIEAARGKDILLGVIDVGTRNVETAAAVADRLRRALAFVAPQRLIGCTDCGMVPLPEAIALAKMHALGAGVARLNAEIA